MCVLFIYSCRMTLPYRGSATLSCSVPEEIKGRSNIDLISRKTMTKTAQRVGKSDFQDITLDKTYFRYSAF
jgi:hypothetical protein